MRPYMESTDRKALERRESPYGLLGHWCPSPVSGKLGRAGVFWDHGDMNSSRFCQHKSGQMHWLTEQRGRVLPLDCPGFESCLLL